MKPSQSAQPVLIADAPEWQAQAMALATRLGLSLAGDHSADGQVRLHCGGDGLVLEVPGLRPFIIDFAGEPSRRARQAGSELLVKAMGRGRSQGVRVLDATAGLGRDGFLLAAAGYTVTLLERQPVLYALLEDGLKRAAADDHLAAICQRMQLLPVDAVSYLSDARCAAEIVYLDPMFPEKKGNAAAGRDSQVLRLLAGAPDVDEGRLLAAARERASRRVVVKRHRGAASLAGAEPSYQLRGSSTRFDIYLA